MGTVYQRAIVKTGRGASRGTQLLQKIKQNSKTRVKQNIKSSSTRATRKVTRRR